MLYKLSTLLPVQKHSKLSFKIDNIVQNSPNGQRITELRIRFLVWASFLLVSSVLHSRYHKSHSKVARISVTREKFNRCQSLKLKRRFKFYHSKSFQIYKVQMKLKFQKTWYTRLGSNNIFFIFWFIIANFFCVKNRSWISPPITRNLLVSLLASLIFLHFHSAFTEDITQTENFNPLIWIVFQFNK